MTVGLITFKSFYSREQAEEISELIQSVGIPVQVVDDSIHKPDFTQLAKKY